MSGQTHIAWADATWNPLAGCRKRSPGCDHCYAIREVHRLAGNPHPSIGPRFQGLTRKINGRLNWTGQVHLFPDRLTKPLLWGKPRRIFLDAMADLFGEGVTEEFILACFGIMLLADWHVYIVLTKEPKQMCQVINAMDPLACVQAAYRLAPEMAWRSHDLAQAADLPWPAPHIILGISAEDQPRLDARLGWLLQTHAALRAISAEPLLQELDLTHVWCEIDQCWLDALRGEWYDAAGLVGADLPAVDLVIFGGESGPGARPGHLDHIRSGVRQCQAAGVAPFVKQWGSVPVMDEGEWRALRRPLMLNARHNTRAPAGTVPILLDDRKGADPAEWPEELRVREFPAIARGMR